MKPSGEQTGNATRRGESRSARVYGRAARSIEGIGASFGITALRISIGTIFLWFGVPKLFPGASPAEALVVETVAKLTFGIIEGTVASVLTGALETLIGALLISGRARSLTIMILLGHMAGTFTPLLILPKETWESFCVGTLEGQYILKNLVIVAAALTLAGHAKSRSRPAPDENPTMRDPDHRLVSVKAPAEPLAPAYAEASRAPHTTASPRPAAQGHGNGPGTARIIGLRPHRHQDGP
ncbi:DoxX family protein [Streptomyces fructofermentans]|uniref:DoxX family protein n=1 Tax=Streptomyces fructofermentans TaxID=152141 RepID=UPI0037B76714